MSGRAVAQLWESGSGSSKDRWDLTMTCTSGAFQCPRFSYSIFIPSEVAIPVHVETFLNHNPCWEVTLYNGQ